MGAQTRTHLPAIFFWSATSLLTAAWFEGFIEPTYMLLRRIPEGYNEGWNAYWAQVAWQGGELYPSPGAAISNNYPPLSFYIVGALGQLIGDNIFAGRIVSELSLLAIAGCIGTWIRAIGMPRSLAVFSATLFLAAFASFASDYIGENDPQMLAHAITIAGATILWWFEFSRRAVVTGCLLIVCGVLTKHLLLPVPIAVTVWIALYRRDRLTLWLITSAIAGVLALAILWHSFGTVFFHDLLSSRVYLRWRVLSRVLQAAQAFGWLLILGAGALLPAIRRDTSRKLGQFATFTLLYLAVAAAIGSLAVGGRGVDQNAFFDTLIAAVLAVSAAAGYLTARLELPGQRAASLAGITLIATSCGVILTWAAVQRWPSDWRAIEHADAREAQTLSLLQTIRSLGPDATACEQLSLCYWAHTHFKVDFFNFGQKLATGALPADSCLRFFSPDSVRLIQSDTALAGSRTLISRMLTPRCNDELLQLYVPVAHSADGTIFRPARSRVPR